MLLDSFWKIGPFQWFNSNAGIIVADVCAPPKSPAAFIGTMHYVL